MMANRLSVQHARKIIGSTSFKLPAACILLKYCHLRYLTLFIKSIRTRETLDIKKQYTAYVKQFSHMSSATDGQMPKNIHLYTSRVLSVPAETLRGRDEDVSQNLTAADFVSQAHIKILASLLGCGVSDVKTLIRQNPFLIHMDLRLIKSKINLLLSFDLPLSFMKQNIRIFYQTSSKVLEERLRLIKDDGLLHSPFLEMDKLPSMLECRGSEFVKTLKLKSDQRNALEGCSDQLTYLQMRLGCSEMKAKNMLCSYPLERHISNVKLKSLLDFLLVEAGRSPEFVISYRKLLTFSLNRLRQRWLIMQKAGIELESQIVYIWCMPQRDFEKKYSEHLSKKRKIN